MCRITLVERFACFGAATGVIQEMEQEGSAGSFPAGRLKQNFHVITTAIIVTMGMVVGLIDQGATGFIIRQFSGSALKGQGGMVYNGKAGVRSFPARLSNQPDCSSDGSRKAAGICRI
jgi:hypothetical protein